MTGREIRRKMVVSIPLELHTLGTIPCFQDLYFEHCFLRKVHYFIVLPARKLQNSADGIYIFSFISSDGVRLYGTAVSNGPTVHPPDDRRINEYGRMILTRESKITQR